MSLFTSVSSESVGSRGQHRGRSRRQRRRRAMWVGLASAEVSLYFAGCRDDRTSSHSSPSPEIFLSLIQLATSSSMSIFLLPTMK